MDSRKKYFTIKEVAFNLGVSESKLRHIENNIPKLNVARINKRRYYTQQNIKMLDEYLKKHSKVEINSLFIEKIDKLINKFKNLYLHIS